MLLKQQSLTGHVYSKVQNITIGKYESKLLQQKIASESWRLGTLKHITVAFTAFTFHQKQHLI